MNTTMSGNINSQQTINKITAMNKLRVTLKKIFAD